LCEVFDFCFDLLLAVLDDDGLVVVEVWLEVLLLVVVFFVLVVDVLNFECVIEELEVLVKLARRTMP
jgi:hypothetical protein